MVSYFAPCLERQQFDPCDRRGRLEGLVKSINELLETMARLRDPAAGCPWDREQTFFSIKPHTLEEAYEVADAIERGDMQDLREELGDLLLQIVFYAQIAHELGVFNFKDVVRGCSEKLKRRHPLVFGGGAGSGCGLAQRNLGSPKSTGAYAKGRWNTDRRLG